MKRSIFKAYDIRGLVPQELDPSAARAIGAALPAVLGGSSFVVGRDMRESGLDLGEALLEGLRGAGAEVIDIGRVSTPICYFAVSQLGASGGVMITASHNPSEYNGFKLCRAQAVPVGIETGLAELRDAAEPRVGEPAGEPRGALRERDVRGDYNRMLLDLFPRRPRLRVVIDAGNGIAGEAALGWLAQLPLDLTRLYFEPDGRFPNHEANPLEPANMVDLQREVLARGADLGVAFDGDGDRAFFVDEQGACVPADLMTALLARTLLEHGLLGARAGEPVVYDLRSSHAVREVVKAAGGAPERGRVGHAFMKQQMRDRGACFGGELSGHYYFRFPAGYVADDAAAACLLLLQLLDLVGRPLSELWRPLARYAQSGELNFRVPDVERAQERVRALFPGVEPDWLDGMTLELPGAWLNLRPSNTEPLLRLNVEADTPEILAELCSRIEGALKE